MIWSNGIVTLEVYGFYKVDEVLGGDGEQELEGGKGDEANVNPFNFMKSLWLLPPVLRWNPSSTRKRFMSNNLFSLHVHPKTTRAVLVVILVLIFHKIRGQWWLLWMKLLHKLTHPFYSQPGVINPKSVVTSMEIQMLDKEDLGTVMFHSVFDNSCIYVVFVIF